MKYIFKNILYFFMGYYPYYITEANVIKYNHILCLLRSLPISLGKDKVILKGEEADRISSMLPVRYRYQPAIKQHKFELVLPVDVVNFFSDGGTYSELDDYECIKNFKMMYGKARKVVVI